MISSLLLTASMVKQGDRSTSSSSADGPSRSTPQGGDFFFEERRSSEGTDQNTKGELGPPNHPPNHSANHPGIEMSTSCREILSVSDLIDKELLSGVRNGDDDPGTSESLPRQKSDMALSRAAASSAVAAPPPNSSLSFARRRCYASAYGANDFFEKDEPCTSESLPRQRSDMVLTRAAACGAVAAAPPPNASLSFARRRCYTSAYGEDDFFEETETSSDDVDEQWWL